MRRRGTSTVLISGKWGEEVEGWRSEGEEVLRVEIVTITPHLDRR